MLPTKWNSNAPASKPSALERAKKRFAEMRSEQQRTTRIGFIVDATGSRHDTWEQAQTVQSRMFRAASSLRSLALRLVHYGGSALVDHGWETQTSVTAARMAQVRCETGLTQIVPALQLFAYEGALCDRPEDYRASAIILIGDAFEESLDDADRAALTLKSAGIKVFSFLEGNDMTAELAFRRLAETTDGKFARLGADLPLADLCEGVALLAAGGEKAAKSIKNSKVQQLLLPGPSKK